MSWKLNHFNPRGSTTFPIGNSDFCKLLGLARQGFGQKKNPWRFCLQGFIRVWEFATLSFPVTGYLAPGPISRFILLFPSAASSPTLFTAHASRRRRSLRPHSRAAATIPDRDLLSEASLPGSVRTCRYGRATHGVDPPTRITL